VALVGGGNNPQPGEVSLAHHDMLYTDKKENARFSIVLLKIIIIFAPTYHIYI
jgi:predicted ATPase with chaperone activity